jgi:hypothetical protein
VNQLRTDANSAPPLTTHVSFQRRLQHFYANTPPSIRPGCCSSSLHDPGGTHVMHGLRQTRFHDGGVSAGVGSGCPRLGVHPLRDAQAFGARRWFAGGARLDQDGNLSAELSPSAGRRWGWKLDAEPVAISNRAQSDESSSPASKRGDKHVAPRDTRTAMTGARLAWCEQPTRWVPGERQLSRKHNRQALHRSMHAARRLLFARITRSSP